MFVVGLELNVFCRPIRYELKVLQRSERERLKQQLYLRNGVMLMMMVMTMLLVQRSILMRTHETASQSLHMLTLWNWTQLMKMMKEVHNMTIQLCLRIIS